MQNNTVGLALNGHNAHGHLRLLPEQLGRRHLHRPGTDTATIDHSYFMQNGSAGGSAIDLVGPAGGGTGVVTDVTLDTNFTQDDMHFFRAWDTNNTILQYLNGDGTPGSDGNLIELRNGNQNFQLLHNFAKNGDADGIYFNSDGGSSNTGVLSGNQFVLNAGTGIEAANNGLDNSTIAFTFSKKNGGSGIRLDAASTGNVLSVNRLNTNAGTDCDDHTIPLSNTWGAGNRGDEQTYDNMCGPKAVTVGP